MQTEQTEQNLYRNQKKNIDYNGYISSLTYMKETKKIMTKSEAASNYHQDERDEEY